ncbi:MULTISPECIES: CPBP family intramembrane glutamic endopeptidase [Haloferax]|uniref:CPBP family intramembrane metalloprotease n=2 Tax=Haloferax TaxID=2251 RepID=A0A6G1Z4G8_9EURY|nr:MULTISPECIES: type II CAAX endopeptidase family protein [Haloferax]KAB1188616.1 CPBP family intramembrane metalloprotease [Haloferax sp. CBA1149]MRW81318.1 CPBP family intramembrane metalloprotease [Haloferax marinisediminis]
MNRGQQPNTRAAGGWRRVGLFLVLTFGWSWAFWIPEAIAAAGLVQTVPDLPELGAFGPTVAAFVIVVYTGGLSGARRLARRAIQLDYPNRWLVFTVLFTPAIIAVSLGVAFVTGTTPSFPWAGNLVVLPIAFVVVLLLGGPIQEEFGWRGVLLDSLQNRLGALWSGVVVGLVWAVWHLPLFYIPSETIYYRNPFVGFAVSITLLSVLMTWVYNNTNGSLLPALLFHASFNWSQVMFPVLDSDPASLAFVVLLAVSTIAVVGYSGAKTLVRGGGEPPTAAR